MDDETVDKLSTLARLEFAADERVPMREDLEKMIAFISKLKEADTTGVAPLIFLTDETNVLRNDVVNETITVKEAMMNVPVSDDGHIMVPKVLPKNI